MTRTTEHQNPETGTDTDWTVIRERAAAFAATWNNDQDLTTNALATVGAAWDDDAR
jgi:hypothetical protein